MRLRGKLLTSFLIPVLIIGILALIAILWSRYQFVETVAKNNVKVQAALEMEINEQEVINNVYGYIANHQQEILHYYEDNLKDFEKSLNVYSQQDLSQSEKEYAAQLEHHYQILKTKSAELIKAEQTQLVTINHLKKIINNSIEAVLDDEWQKTLSETDAQYKEKNQALLELEINAHELISASRGYVLDQDPFLKSRIEDSIDDSDTWLQKLGQLSLSNEEKIWYSQIKKYQARAKQYAANILEFQDKKVSLHKEIAYNSNKLNTLLDDKVQVAAFSDLKQSKELISVVSYLIFAIIIFILIVSILIVIAFSNRVLLTPIAKLKRSANQVAKGETDVQLDITSADELGDLAHNFKTLIDNSKTLADVAIALGKGHFDTPISVRSKKDDLGHALITMRDSLLKLDEDNKQQVWVKTQVTNITQSVQGIRDLKALLQTVTTSLAETLQVGYAACFMLDPDKKENQEACFILTASFAYRERKGLSNRFKMGEGIIGQCAIEKEPIILTEVPDDYIKVVSALGEKVPSTIVAIPVLFEDNVVGVFEFAAFKQLTQDQTSILYDVIKNLGIIINNIQSHQRTESLLQESQQLAEELQSQQEELQANNEELEEKTRILKQSEEELKSQSEELQAANEELEEKTEHLAKQKLDIEQKNTEIEAASDQLKKKAKDLEMASKYKSQFLANMSHELRTPLNSLLILAKTFVDNKEENLSDKQIEAAKVIYHGGNELLNLINDILDLSKVEAGKLQLESREVAIQNMRNSLIAQFEPVAQQHQITFSVNIEDDVEPTIMTDEQRVLQILKNLLSNAFKFTKQGSVTVNVAKLNQSTQTNQTDIEADNAIIFSVIDTGIGIAKEKQTEIFEAFQQADGSTSRKYGGTGLGLTISRELAKLLHGELTLTSEEGRGSTFSLIIPTRLTVNANSRKSDSKENEVTATPAEDASTKEAEVPCANHEPAPFVEDDRDNITDESRVLLIIEDDINFIRVLMELAHDKGYLCVVSESGKNGLLLAEKFIPSAIILDLGLPDISGLKVLEQIKSDLKTRHIPVHIISGRKETPEVRQKGAIGFLEKPAKLQDIEVVFDKIETMIDNRIKNLLVIEDDQSNQAAIKELIESKELKMTFVQNGKEGLNELTHHHYDTVILDLNLPDLSGVELLRELNQRNIELPPIIIYTGREITEEEHAELSQYAASIVIKGAESPERLVDETSLFLHSVESTLSAQQKKMIRTLHDTDKVLVGRKVLLVDDDMRNVFALSSVLEGHGLQVVIATNGQVALDKLHEDTDIELVIMDIMMPVMDGYEAMEKIRQDEPFKNIPIIALTAKAMPEDSEKCLHAGANDYMTKPVDMDQLVSMLKVWLFK